MSAERKKISTSLVLTLLTGKSFGDRLSAVQEAFDWVLGAPVWTHELAMQSVWDRGREFLIRQHPGLRVAADQATETMTTAEAEAFQAEWTKRLGAEIEIERGTDERTCSPLETAAELMPGKQIIAIEAGDG